jgi:hypothetical protein
MSATSAPFGMRPAYHPSGLDRASAYTIGTGYASAIYKGSPVILNTDGTLNIGTTNADIIGVFDGVEYTDSTGKPTKSNFWPASTTATPSRRGCGTTRTRCSTSSRTARSRPPPWATRPTSSTRTRAAPARACRRRRSTTPSRAPAVQGQLRIVGLNGDPGNAWGDTYTVVQVQIARHQYVSNKTAI